MLLCTVRGCRLPLQQDQQRLVCSQGHSFDVASSGYVNLLQPQDKRSRTPGDTAHAVAARTRLHDRGITRPLQEQIVHMAATAREDLVLDAGCGDGFYLGRLTKDGGFGIDISVTAIQAASRRYPGNRWIVGNADRFLPFADRSFTLLLSITGRMNAPEFRRVMRDDGHLLIAVPAPDDLIELRGKGRDRVTRTVEMFAGRFQLIRQERATTTADLDASAVDDVRLAIYRPLHREAAQAMSLTFSFDLLLFGPV